MRINYPRPPTTPRIPVLIIGGVHAREWAPPDALVTFAEKLAAAVGLGPLFPVDAVTYPPFRKTAMENEGLNRRPVPGAPRIPFPSVVIARDAVESIFNRLDIYILPLVNPDGRAFTLSGIDRPSRMWWRKNRKAPTPPVGPAWKSTTSM